MYTGLTDIDYKGNIVPGIAESWEPNKDLTAWVFRLRKGVLFHNVREVDAEAVKLNILRIKDPAIGSDWHRGAVAALGEASLRWCPAGVLPDEMQQWRTDDLSGYDPAIGTLEPPHHTGLFVGREFRVHYHTDGQGFRNAGP